MNIPLGILILISGVSCFLGAVIMLFMIVYILALCSREETEVSDA